MKKGSHAPRFCKNCDVYKPPRGMLCTILSLGRDWLTSSAPLSTVQSLRCGSEARCVEVAELMNS